jgi:hypothetical protein
VQLLVAQTQLVNLSLREHRDDDVNAFGREPLGLIA